MKKISLFLVGLPLIIATCVSYASNNSSQPIYTMPEFIHCTGTTPSSCDFSNPDFYWDVWEISSGTYTFSLAASGGNTNYIYSKEDSNGTTGFVLYSTSGSGITAFTDQSQYSNSWVQGESGWSCGVGGTVKSASQCPYTIVL